MPMLNIYNLKLCSFLFLSLIISSSSDLLPPMSQHTEVGDMSGGEKDILRSPEPQLQAARTHQTLDLNIV